MYVQACGKFYSSEWNLDRHKRESCQTKVVIDEGAVFFPIPEEVTLSLKGKRYIVSRNSISNDFGSFQTFFSAYNLKATGEISLDVDANDFRAVINIFNHPHTISAVNIDLVTHVSDRLKIPVVFDLCVKYISEELPKISVMHALRLAEEYHLNCLKQRLLDSISIEVFRSLSADHNYKLLDAELKAELLEKWGTFL
ncbi:unnamed protein product [Auanema sp. JU1783]|nr:unnamed protein product [Auanema sp. JU1783]